MHFLYHNLVRSSESNRIRSLTKFSFSRLALPNLLGTISLLKTICTFWENKKACVQILGFTIFFDSFYSEIKHSPAYRTYAVPFHLLSVSLSLPLAIRMWVLGHISPLTIKRSPSPSVLVLPYNQIHRGDLVSHDYKTKTDFIYQVGPTRLSNEASLLQTLT